MKRRRRGHAAPARRAARPRDPQGTRRRILEALGALLAREGFSAVGVNAVASEADVDKVLIYRYFGGLDGLLAAYGRTEEFWPTLDELVGPDPERLAALPQGERASFLLVNYLRALRKRPLTLEILAWETVERNGLTQALDAVREDLATRVLHEFGQDFERGRIDAGAVAALLTAGIAYLLLRGRTARRFVGLEIGKEQGWRRLESAIDLLCRRLWLDVRKGRSS